MYPITAGVFLASYISYASAIFTLIKPIPQSIVIVSGPKWPCGGGSGSSGWVSDFEVVGGQIQLNLTQTQTSIQVLLNSTGNPNSFTAIGTSFVVQGTGNFCFPRYLSQSAGWKDGDDATIQIVTDGPQYQCADVTIKNLTAVPPSDLRINTCINATGVKVVQDLGNTNVNTSSPAIIVPISQGGIAATSSVPSTSLTTSSSVSPTSLAASSNAAVGSSSSLSTGAKVAIGVCIPVVFLAVLLAALCLLRRKKRMQSLTFPDNANNAPEVLEKSNDPSSHLEQKDHGPIYVTDSMAQYPPSTYELPGNFAQDHVQQYTHHHDTAFSPNSSAPNHHANELAYTGPGASTQEADSHHINELAYTGPGHSTQEADSHHINEMPYTGPPISIQQADSHPLHEASAYPASPYHAPSQPYTSPTEYITSSHPHTSARDQTASSQSYTSPPEQSAPSQNRPVHASPTEHVAPWSYNPSSYLPETRGAVPEQDDAAELAQIEAAMVQVRERKQRLQQLEDLAREEEKMERRKRELQGR